MPHVIVKMHPGRTAEQKNELARAVTEAVIRVAKCEERVVSVAIEEIPAEEWPERVYRPDIMEKKETLVKEPGYNPFAEK